MLATHLRVSCHWFSRNPLQRRPGVQRRIHRDRYGIRRNGIRWTGRDLLVRQFCCNRRATFLSGDRILIRWNGTSGSDEVRVELKASDVARHTKSHSTKTQEIVLFELIHAMGHNHIATSQDRPSSPSSHRSTSPGAATNEVKTLLRPKMPIRKGPPAPRLQIPFKPSRLRPSQKGKVGLQGPRAKLRSMRHKSRVMSPQPGLQIFRQTNIPFIRMRDTTQQINILHAINTNPNHPPNKPKNMASQPKPWQRQGEGWWRRRESNPRPRTPTV